MIEDSSDAETFAEQIGQNNISRIGNPSLVETHAPCYLSVIPELHDMNLGNTGDISTSYATLDGSIERWIAVVEGSMRQAGLPRGGEGKSSFEQGRGLQVAYF